MNEANVPNPSSPAIQPARQRRTHAAASKRAAAAHCQRHGGDPARTAQELGGNHWTLRDWAQEHRRNSSRRPRLAAPRNSRP